MRHVLKFGIDYGFWPEKHAGLPLHKVRNFCHPSSTWTSFANGLNLYLVAVISYHGIPSAVVVVIEFFINRRGLDFDFGHFVMVCIILQCNVREA